MIKGRSETVSRDFWSEQGSEKEILKVTDEKKQRLCSEYRKAQSRLAARGRRDRESQLFSELAALLPLPLDMGAQLDKASVIRLTVGYFRLRTLLDPVDHCSPDHSIDIAGFYDVPTGPMHPFTSVATDKELSSDDMFSEEKLLDSALGGFLLLISLNGQIIFTTKDVNKYLGTNQLDLIGRSFFDFIHPCDQKEVKEILTKLIGDEEQQKCSMILRIKSAINQRMASWKVLHFAGVRKPSLPQGSSCLVLLCRPLPIHDISRMCTGLGFKTFLSMHSPDMKFTYCNSRVLEATGFTDTDLFGQSVYNYYHASDSHCMLQAHRCLLSKGQMTTGKYRFLHKHGGYVWTETEASVVYNIQTGQPQCVFCINYVLSDVESSEVVFSLEQREGFQKPHVICPQALADITFQKGNEAPAAIPDSITPLSELFKDLEVPASFFCELYDMDLDTLAPYIPMDGEDFLLTPLLEDLMERQQTSQRNALQDNSTLFRHSEVPNHVGTVLPASRYYRSTAPLETWSDCRAFPQCTHTPRIFQKQFKNSRQSSKLTGLFHNWGTGKPEFACKKQRNEVPPHSQANDLHHALVYRREVQGRRRNLEKIPHQYAVQQMNTGKAAHFSCQDPPKSVNCPHGHTLAQDNWGAVGQTNTSEQTLPVLSPWECEINAPLGPSSYLLNGKEITSVLDQAASRLLTL